uniref:Uncharacterized protein n=1 Tax=Nelumbo nucifera TaxID=4432 RepID=A0A822XJS7_NELNU|nr:TPA_asm: hypothetical protein HUJ06_020528 [Nelumbo nucifera]
MKDSIILFPSPGIGHLVSMVEVGRLVLNSYLSISITILIATLPFNLGSVAPYINRVSTATSLLSLFLLTLIPLPTMKPLSSNSSASTTQASTKPSKPSLYPQPFMPSSLISSALPLLLLPPALLSSFTSPQSTKTPPRASKTLIPI